jgi:hypothetical protein
MGQKFGQKLARRVPPCCGTALNASCSGPVESPKGVRRAGRKAEGPHAARAALLLDLVLLL